jgi:uncharacterized protein YndB with AHSA1/START domain
MLATATRQDFVITRIFDAPRPLVWNAWTDAERLAKWWGPKGCTLRVITLDMRPGGIFHYAMEFQPGQAMYGRFVYGNIVAPETFSFVSSFADEAGNVIRAPFSATWPLEVRNTITLTDKGDRTELTLRGGPIDPTDAEYETFLGMFASMQQGWGGTFDKLDELLAHA